MRLNRLFSKPGANLALGLCLLTGAHPAFANVTITGVTGASVPLSTPTTTTGTTTTTGGYTIYGGTAGFNVNGIQLSNPTPGLPYNTCLFADGVTAGKLSACNQYAIDGTVILTITYKSDKSGFPILIDSSSSSVITPTQLPGAGTTGQVSFRWSDICQKMNSNGSSTVDANTCTVSGSSSAQHTFQLGINSTTPTPASTTSDDTAASVNIVVSSYIGQDNGGTVDGTSVAEPCTITGATGICAFNISNGDSKVQIDHMHPGVMTGALQFTSVRLLWTPATGPTDTASFSNISALSPYRDLPLTTDTNNPGSSLSLDNPRVDGLENDRYYAFKAALVDQAGNVGYYTSPNNSADTYCAYSPGPNCHIGNPGEVVGVLSQNMQCFVATAAFGSQMAPQVETFRQFRNQFLLPAKWGLKFVKFYYRHSPEYARIIAQNETLRTIARVSLWPLLAFAWLSLQFGITWAALISFATLATLGWTVRRSWKALKKAREA